MENQMIKQYFVDGKECQNFKEVEEILKDGQNHHMKMTGENLYEIGQTVYIPGIIRSVKISLDGETHYVVETNECFLERGIKPLAIFIED